MGAQYLTPEGPAVRTTPSPLRFRVTRDPRDVRAAQALRHLVFVREHGARVDDADGLERDRFDPVCDHLVVHDPAHPERGVVATMRFGYGERGFYTASEFDIAPLLASGRRLVEMGRACLHPDYRGGAAAFALFGGMLRHLRATGSDVVFGTASFPNVDTGQHMDALRFLHAHHLAPDTLRPRAIGPQAVSVEGAPRPGAEAGLPALIRAYLRSGAWVGQGAWIDRGFNTVDVCMLLELRRATPGGARGPRAAP